MTSTSNINFNSLPNEKWDLIKEIDEHFYYRKRLISLAKLLHEFNKKENLFIIFFISEVYLNYIHKVT